VKPGSKSLRANGTKSRSRQTAGGYCARGAGRFSHWRPWSGPAIPGPAWRSRLVWP